MRRRSLIAITLLAAGCAPSSGPGPVPAAPERLGPGVLSTAASDYNPSLGPDGRTLVFARSEPDFRNARIHVSRWSGGQWSAPEPAPFSLPGDSDPTLSPDGQTLYFASARPAAGRDSTRRDLDLWRVRRQGGGWGAPEHLGPGVNTPAQELGPSCHDEWLYFGSSRGGRARMLDLFRARDTGSGFGAAEAVDAVNSPASEGDPELSADGRTLVFWSDRPGGRGGDLYVSRLVDGAWTTPVGVAGANSAGFDFTPEISPDGRWLYFASTRAPGTADAKTGDATADLYRVSAAVLR